MLPDPCGGFALDLLRGRVRLLPSGAAAAAPPRIVGLTVHTSDQNRAIVRLLADRGIAHRLEGDVLEVDAEAAGGVVLRFLPLA